MSSIFNLMTTYEWLSLIISGGGIWAIVHTIRQNTKQAKAGVFFEFTKRYAEIDKDTEYTSSYYRNSEISKSDTEKYYKFLDQYIDLVHQEFELRRRKLIDKGIWKIWEAYAKAHVAHPTFKNYWESERGRASFLPNPEFIEFIDGLAK